MRSKINNKKRDDGRCVLLFLENPEEQKRESPKARHFLVLFLRQSKANKQNCVIACTHNKVLRKHCTKLAFLRVVTVARQNLQRPRQKLKNEIVLQAATVLCCVLIFCRRFDGRSSMVSS
jgi:hypothetical protein